MVCIELAQQIDVTDDLFHGFYFFHFVLFPNAELFFWPITICKAVIVEQLLLLQHMKFGGEDFIINIPLELNFRTKLILQFTIPYIDDAIKLQSEQLEVEQNFQFFIGGWPCYILL